MRRTNREGDSVRIANCFRSLDVLRTLTARIGPPPTRSWEEEYDQVSCLHSLKHRGVLASTAPEACSALAWNAGGTVLAAAYGPLDRTDWASQSSMPCTWSVFRRQLDPAKADLALELPARRHEAHAPRLGPLRARLPRLVPCRVRREAEA